MPKMITIGNTTMRSHGLLVLVRFRGGVFQRLRHRGPMEVIRRTAVHGTAVLQAWTTEGRTTLALVKVKIVDIMDLGTAMDTVAVMMWLTALVAARTMATTTRMVEDGIGITATIGNHVVMANGQRPTAAIILKTAIGALRRTETLGHTAGHLLVVGMVALPMVGLMVVVMGEGVMG
mmetsp:Transcript_75132/g.207242  ORF Transcript_75132/g.207242 Transcript_75132/m.207242 type:complete len:177 (+) Transcript_75132:316-846(+)